MGRARGRTPDADTHTKDASDTGGWRVPRTDATAAGFPDRFWVLVTGLLVVTLPALTLLVAYVALTATRSVAVGQLTPTEAAELYLIEVVAFAAFSYLLYRLTLYSARRQVVGSGDDLSGEGRPSVERSEAE